jgi:opacity protein-like surface antigen
MIMKKLIVAAIIALVLNATPSLAGSGLPGPENPDSGSVGVFYPRIDFQGDTGKTFEGAGVRIGFSREKVLGYEISAFKAWQDNGSSATTELTGITFDIKLSLPLFPVVAPYGIVGLGRYVLENSQTVYRGNQDGSGINGYQVGAGIDFYLSQSLSFNLGYTKRRMEFDSGTPGNVETHKEARTYDIGLAFHFQ